MYIDKKLFGKCFCPATTIGRVCLKSDKGLPEELIAEAKEIDGENYNPTCFSLDVFDDGATVNYTTEDDFFTLGVCDNWEEAFEHYITKAKKRDLIETFEETLGDYEVCVMGMETYKVEGAFTERQAIIRAMDYFRDDDLYFDTEEAENVTEEDCEIIDFERYY